MTEFARYAVFFAPLEGSDFARAGATWLGWDPDSGESVAQPDLGGDLAALTHAPRKYGLHGTLKPPMRLTVPAATFLDGVETLAQGLAPVAMGRMCLRPLNGFLAIVPEQQSQALDDLAASVVRALDPFRAPLSAHDLARRREAGLTPRQGALLQSWGYPYVLDEFRFHITLTGRLSPAALPDALRVAQAWFGPVLDMPHLIEELAVFGEDMQGQFHRVRRFALKG